MKFDIKFLSILLILTGAAAAAAGKGSQASQEEAFV